MMKACALHHPHRFFLIFILLTAAVGPLLSLDPQKSISQYIHKRWTIEDGLPQQIYSIAQTPDGYLWLGTIEGLFRFDGIRFTRYDPPSESPLKPGYVISKLLTTPEGHLWFAAADIGLFRLRNNTLESFSGSGGIPSTQPLTTALDAAGVLWVGTSGQGLIRWQNGEITQKTPKDGLASDSVSTLFADRQAAIWIGTDKGLNRLHQGRITTYSRRDGLLSNYITAIRSDSQGRLWVGTDKGLHLFANKGFVPWKGNEAMGSPHATCMLADRDGTFWVGTRGGLSRIRNDSADTFTDKDGLSNSFVRTLFQDSEGSLWIGTAGGLDQLRDGKLTSFGKKEGLSSNYTTCIYEDSQNTLWIGNGERGLNTIKGGKIGAISVKDGLAHNNISCIWSDRENSVWIGTWGAGVNRFKNGKWSLIDSASGLSSDFINAIYQDSSGNIWIGTDGSGLNRMTGKSIDHYFTGDGLAGNFISTLREDRTGNIWIGTEEGGVSLYRNGRFTNYSTRNGLSGNSITCIHQDEDGHVWLGTRHNGLNLFRNGKFTAIRKANGLFHDTIYNILEDKRKNLWMSTPQGIFSISRLDLLLFAEGKLPSVSCTLYGRPEGMRNIQCVGHSQNSGCKTRDGRLWFPTMEGAVMANPAHIQINWQPPEVKIEEFFADGSRYPTDQKITLPPGRRSFEFHYTALLLAAPEKAQFKYRLEGFDQKWIEARSRRVAYYTAIAPGNYRFRVIACNSDGVWNDLGATFTFHLKPRFYQSDWFLPFCVLLLFLIAASVFGIRVATLKKKHGELSLLVQERTKELQEEKEKLEKANVAKSEFLSFAAHDLKNPLQTVIGYAEIILGDSSQSPDVQQSARRITAAAERMLDLIDELMQSSLIENGQIKLNRGVCNLSALCERIVQAWQSFAGQKGQAILLSADPDLKVLADEHLIQEALENLISNAIKFSPGGKSIWVSLTDAGQTARFCVRDEGPGLTESDMQRVFGRFQRLSAQPTAGESSTGLGLFIVKQMIELHGGRIWVESQPGAGSTFFIELPKLP